MTVFFVKDEKFEHLEYVLAVTVTDIQDGIIRGWVENGHYHLAINTVEKTLQALGMAPIGYVTIEAMPVTIESKDYNEIIEWAKLKRLQQRRENVD